MGEHLYVYFSALKTFAILAIIYLRATPGREVIHSVKSVEVSGGAFGRHGSALILLVGSARQQ